MNDRLKIASRISVSDDDWPSDFNNMGWEPHPETPYTDKQIFIWRQAIIARIRLAAADALLAAAGEQEPTRYSPISIVDQPVSRAEYDRQVARAEAAEAKCADLERENAALRRQAEPLTRDELVESGDARKFWHGLTVTETIALVAAADRIRSRRFSNG